LIGVCLAVIAVAASVADAETPPASTGAPLRVVIFDDVGGGGVGPTNLERCLGNKAFTVRRVKGSDIRDGVLKDADVLIQPGGSGSKQAATLGEQGCANIRKFVEAGGGYVGVCAGAYLATTQYTWSLGILDARVIDREHWARGTGDVEVKLSDAGCKFFAAPSDVVTIYYGQGPLLGPGGRDDVPDFEALGTYQTEIAKKGAPEGVMKGTTAAAIGTFGDGRVFCFSPHPEKTEGLDGYIRAAVTWAGKK
jgi:hypothetical protein